MTSDDDRDARMDRRLTIAGESWRAQHTVAYDLRVDSLREAARHEPVETQGSIPKRSSRGQARKTTLQRRLRWIAPVAVAASVVAVVVAVGITPGDHRSGGPVSAPGHQTAIGGSSSEAPPNPAVDSPASSVTETPRSVSLDRVDMVDAETGWAFGGGEVLLTTDAGSSWHVQSPDGWGPADFQQPLNQPVASFAQPDLAWIAAGSPGAVTIWSTTDAGRSWSSATVDPAADAGAPSDDVPRVLSLTSPTATEGFLLTTAGGIAAGSHDVELYRTGDGGSSWTLIAATTQQQPSSTGLPAGGIKTGIGFADAAHGWLTGYRGTGSGIWLYETADGGRTWHPATLPTPDGVAADDSAQTYPPLFTGRTGILPVTWPGNPSTTVFFTTVDNGASWTATAPITTTNPMLFWHWVDAANGFAANDDTWCRTTDAAQSWNCAPLLPELSELTSLDFITPTIGCAVSAGHLYQTADGGTSWHLISAAITG